MKLTATSSAVSQPQASPRRQAAKPVYTAKSGNSSLEVRKYQNRGRPIYTIAIKDAAGLREPISRRDLDKIITLADKLVVKMATNGWQSKAQTLAALEKSAQQFTELKALTEPLHLSPREVIKAHLRFTEDLKGVPLVQVVQMFTRAGAVQIVPAKVPEVVGLFLSQKPLQKKGEEYVKQIKSTLNLFADNFSGQIDSLTSVEIETWLFDLDIEETTRRTYHGRLCQLFNFAQARRNLMRGLLNEMNFVPMPSPKRKKAVIIAPEEMTEALALAHEFAPDPDTLLHLVLAGFAGLREVELQTLCWEDIVGDEDGANPPQIVLREDQVKSNTFARSVEVLPTLRAFLQPFRLAGLTGPVFSISDIKHKTSKLLPRWSALKAGLADTQATPPALFVWKRNFLRRGFGSYRMSQLKSVDLVTTEMGNTDFVLLNFYTTPVFKLTADKYWGIAPSEGYVAKVQEWLATSTWRGHCINRADAVAQARAARM